MSDPKLTVKDDASMPDSQYMAKNDAAMPDPKSTPKNSKRLQDADLEKVIGNLLRYGVLTASLIVLAGGVIYLCRHGRQFPDYHQFKGEPDKMIQPRLLWQAVLRGEGRPLIQLGLLVLIATPIARIVFSIFGYLMEKDYLYTVLTVIVLLVILWNF